MRMRKLILSLLITLCAAFTFAGVACKDNQESSSELTYTVTLDANGGTFTSGTTTSVSVKAGETVTITETPTRDGWTFDGWTLDGHPYALSTPVTSNITLYATYVYAEIPTYTVTFTETDGVTYESEFKSGDQVPKGDLVSFKVNVSAFYTGSPLVVAGGKVLKETDGIYSFRAQANTTVTVTGVREAFSAMSGTGAFDDAFVVSAPIDLLFIAKQVNAGVSKYVLGNYVLANDIDVKGCELDVIGDASTESSFFGGCFYGQGYTISNFVINSSDNNYVGLFGWVMVNPGTQSSGLIRELNIENFEINASVDDFEVSGDVTRTLAVGSMVGYSIGAQLQLCSAKDGEVNVYADKDYFSYAGGLIGFQQSTNYNGAFYGSSIIYSYVENTEINASEGLVLYAGGISGYLMTDYPLVPSFILNSYMTGSVKGAARTGGLVGGLGQYCAIANCYSTATVSARSTFNDLGIYDEYCTASAGGLVAYAENDSVVSASFATGTLSAHAVISGSQYTMIGGIVANSDKANEASIDSKLCVTCDCLYVEGGVNGILNLTNQAFLQAYLQWKNLDWIFFTDGTYPVINYEAPAEDADPSTCTLTVQLLGGEKKNSVTSMTHELNDYYYSFSELYQESLLPMYVTSDSKKISYGYFFDEACTARVPYGYMVTGDVTVYLPFADYSEVAGEYYIVPRNASNASKLVLKADSTFTFEESGGLFEGNYVYNGEFIIFENTRFARFFEGVMPETDENGNAIHVLDKYEYAYYKGVINSQGNLDIYDGFYFTQVTPLTALSTYGIHGNYYANGVEYSFYVNYTGRTDADAFTYTLNGTALTLTFQNETSVNGTFENGVLTLGGVALSEYDAFKGVWEKGNAYNRNYTFDGKGGWSFEAFGYVYEGLSAEKTVLSSARGTYTIVSSNEILLDNGLVATLEDGVLTVGETAYYAQMSHKGEWKDFANQIVLTLNGLENGEGEGEIEYLLSGEVYKLTYQRETKNSSTLLLFADGVIFGSIQFNKNMDMLNASLYSSASGTILDGYEFVHYDKYTGEWVSNFELFEILDFNGLGNYQLTYPLFGGGFGEISGVITVNGEEVEYELSNDGKLDGSFVYEGITYSFSYDETTQKVSVTFAGGEAELERKDKFSSFNFIDNDGVIYDFDGKGNLTGGGKLTITSGETETVYGYTITDSGADVYNTDKEKVATVALNANETAYVYKAIENGVETVLYQDHIFRGEWAINGGFGKLVIGAMDLSGKMQGSILGKLVEFTYVDDSMIIYQQSTIDRYIFSAKNDEGKTVLAMSDTEVLSTNYVICTEIDKMYGTWQGRTENVTSTITREYTLQFDGASDPQYVYGTAKLIVKTYNKGVFNRSSETVYSYRIDENGNVIMWSEDVGTFRLDFTLSEGYDGQFALGDKSFVRIQVDGLYSVVAKDSNNVTYTFDGEGGVTASNGKTYTYEITSYTTGRYELSLTCNEDGTTYTAVLDTSIPSNFTIVLTLLETAA